VQQLGQHRPFGRAQCAQRLGLALLQRAHRAPHRGQADRRQRQVLQPGILCAAFARQQARLSQAVHRQRDVRRRHGQGARQLPSRGAGFGLQQRQHRELQATQRLRLAHQVVEHPVGHHRGLRQLITDDAPQRPFVQGGGRRAVGSRKGGLSAVGWHGIDSVRNRHMGP